MYFIHVNLIRTVTTVKHATIINEGDAILKQTNGMEYEVKWQTNSLKQEML